MGILQKIFGNSTVIKAIRQPFSANVSSLFGSIYNTIFTRRDYISEYKNWVYSCCNARSEDVANIELMLFKDDERIFEHPILDLLNRVNPYMTKHDLFSATQTYKDLDGNCYWFLAREEKSNNEGEIKEIYVLRPDKVQIITNKTNPLLIEGYVYTQPDGKKIPFAPSEIIHHKNFNPAANHPFPGKGMGIVEAAHLTIYTDNQMRLYNAAFFKNSARPDGMLIPAGDSAMSPEEYKRLKEEWNEEHKGSENAHKIAIMQGGLKWEPISSSQVDMQYIDQKRFNRDEILAMFRVPKTLVGISEDVNRANADAAIYVFSLKTIKPLMQKLVDTLNEFLLPEFDEEGLRLDFKSPVPDDKDAMRADFTAGIDKWFTRNEIRAVLGLPPTENGDQFFGTFSQMPIDSIKPEDKKSIPSPKPAVKDSKPKTAGADIVDKFVAKLPKASTKGIKEVNPLAKKQYIELWKNHLQISGNALRKKLVTYFEKQEEQVQKNLREELKGFNPHEFKLKGVSDILFDKEKAVDAGISLITPFIKDYIKRSGEQATVLAGGEDFDTETPKIEKFIPKRAEYFAETVNDTTAADLMRTIQEGIEEGEDLDSISERVADVYNIAKTSRTDMIARTEVSASSNFGSIEAYKQAGIEKQQWIVVDPTDEDCLMNDGQIVKIGEPFNDGSIQPPDPHPNCECTTIPVFEDDEE